MKTIYALHHNNCDNYPSNWEKWDYRPSKKEIAAVLCGHYEGDKLEEIVEELSAYGHCTIEGGDCTQFEIQTI
jgi:hypothetical protein